MQKYIRFHQNTVGGEFCVWCNSIRVLKSVVLVTEDNPHTSLWTMCSSEHASDEAHSLTLTH